MSIRKIAKENRVHHTEHSRGRTYTKASVTITVPVNKGLRRIRRKAYRISCITVSISHPVAAHSILLAPVLLRQTRSTSAGAPRLCHSGCDLLLCQLFDMKSQTLLHITIGLRKSRNAVGPTAPSSCRHLRNFFSTRVMADDSRSKSPLSLRCSFLSVSTSRTLQAVVSEEPQSDLIHPLYSRRCSAG